MRLSAFDFGSNSIKCLIADITGNQIIQICNLRAQNRLAKWLTNGVLPDAAVHETIALLQPLLDSCRELEVKKLLAVGTEALRKATNREEFTQKIKAACGLQIRVISPVQEAELAWKGVTGGIKATDEDICLFDSGGASTEFILGNTHKIKQMKSLTLGAVSLSQSYQSGKTLSSGDFDNLESIISAALNLPFAFSGRLIGSGGGAVACAKVALGSERFDTDILEGFVLGHDELQRQIKLYRNSSIAERRAIPGMEPERADIIPVSALLFSKILEYFQLPGFSISTRGLRHGMLEGWRDGTLIT